MTQELKLKYQNNLYLHLIFHLHLLNLSGIHQLRLRALLNLEYIKNFLTKNKVNIFVLVNPSHPFEKNWNLNELEEIIKFCKSNKIKTLKNNEGRLWKMYINDSIKLMLKKPGDLRYSVYKQL